MRNRVLILLATCAAFPAFCGSAASSDPDTVALVKSIVPTNEGCSEGSGGRLVTCEAHTRAGQLSVYVDQSDTATINVDLAVGVRASMGDMTMFWSGVRDVVGKLGLNGDAYLGCTTGNTGSASFSLANYQVDCRSYNRPNTLNYDLRFKRK